MRALLLGAVSLVAAQIATAYVRAEVPGSSGVFIHRADFSNIQFYANQSIAPGLNNSSGAPFITSDSDPVSALKAALASWSSIPISAVKFAPLKTTDHVNDPNDRQHTFVFLDTPEIRSALGTGRLAITLYFFQSDGTIVDSDIIFNPIDTFSTTLAPKTYDIQSVAAHELGHALGANHTGVLSATMFQSTPPATNIASQLSADDTAFASAAYPATGASPYGTISGTATTSGGAPLRGALVTAFDKDAGVTIGGLSGLTDGAFSFQAPAGNYQVYVEPLTGNVKPANLSLTSSQVDINFQPTFLGGNDSPTVTALTAGSRSTINLPATSGTSGLQIQFSAVGSAEGSGGAAIFFPGAVVIPSGRALDLLLAGPRVDGSSVRVFGPGVTLRPGSVHVDRLSGTLNGLPIVRMTLDIASRSDTASGSLFLTNGVDTAALSGGLVVTPPKPVISEVLNAASVRPQSAIAPGTYIAIKGLSLAANTRVWAGSDFVGLKLPTALDGTSVLINGKKAYIYFISSAQINAIAPADTTIGPVTVQVVLNGQPSDAFTATLQNVAPAFFAFYPGTSDDGKYLAVAHGDGSGYVGKAGLFPTAPTLTSPAKPGELLAFYGTGFGPTVPAITDGQVTDVNYNLDPKPGITIGNIPATVSFAGLVPPFAAVYFFQVVVPATAPDGDLQVIATVNGVSSPTGFFITVKK